MGNEEEVIRELLAAEGYAALNPVQQDAVSAGLLEGKSIVVSAPTAAGKTLIAEMAILNALRNGAGKCVYIVPLRALAAEKYAAFRRKFAGRIGIATGDFDSTAAALAKYDVLIVTSEKMDSIMRHAPDWLHEIALVVADEVHVLGDAGRGAALEVVLARLRSIAPNSQRICLSATIPNADELAGWLGAALVKSDYRPVKLRKGICCGGSAEFEGRSIALGRDALAGIAKHCIVQNGQMLVFVSTRKAAEATAEKLGGAVQAHLSENEKTRLQALSKKISAVLDRTSQCSRLAAGIAQGVAFHHAALRSRERMLIEKAFKEKRLLKAIACTTTLAMGIDYPASWVVVRDAYRYDGAGSAPLPNLEVQQMLGRAGRPRYDSEGYAALVAKSDAEREALAKRYLHGRLENIYSQLSSEPALRFHALACIAGGYAHDAQSLERFFSSTFFAYQYGRRSELAERLGAVLTQLQDMGFVKRDGDALAATLLGRRVSDLYLDPLSAHELIGGMKKTEHKTTNALTYLMLFCSALEMRPYMGVRRREEEAVLEKAYENELLLLESEYDYAFAGKFKTALVLEAWTNGDSEESILEQYDVPPGVLRARVRIAEWIAYACAELAALLQLRKSADACERLRRRIKHGVREELLQLVQVRGVGRVRARRLFNAGYKTILDLRKADKSAVERITGLKEITLKRGVH
jgi:helicase